MLPTPITTTSSPTVISLYWTTPFHAPESGSVRQAALKGEISGFVEQRAFDGQHVFGKRAGAYIHRAIATRSESLFTVMMSPCAAVFTVTTETRRHDDNRVAFFELGHALPNRSHDTTWFMTRNKRELDVPANAFDGFVIGGTECHRS